jgi:formylglycine-generating enzyme required for sulfatase activity
VYDGNTSANRVLRGGGWSIGASHLRSAFRDNRSPSDRDGALGFRVSDTVN